MSRAREPAMLVLADARVFEGYAFGARGETTGEVIFNTAMSGYQEIVTDPSYRAQIVVMTAAHIGNTGVNPHDTESDRPQCAGLVVRTYHPAPSSWRAAESLDAYLQRANIVAIEGVDTRALTRHIRERGAQNGIISHLDLDPERLARKAREAPPMAGRDLVREVTCAAPYRFPPYPDGATVSPLPEGGGGTRRGDPLRVVAYDFGVKRNLLRSLVAAGCEVTVVPASTTAREALALDPDGIFLSNGPGDPAALPDIVEGVRVLMNERPLFGVCLGHQLLGLALYGSTYKLKFGHRGANQPVMDLTTGKVEITSHNHGFAVDEESLKAAGVLVSHLNLNDKTVEGLAHPSRPAFGVQYHPEACPGPHDAHYLFGRFAAEMERSRGASGGGSGGRSA